MRAFKTYMKILQKSVFSTVIMFTSIFVVFGVIFTTLTPSTAETLKLDTTPVAVIDRDGSELSQALTTYLAQRTKPITLKDDETAFRDALFFAETRLIAVIPQGFSEHFLAQEPMEIETILMPNVAGAVLAKNLINSYLSAADLQLAATGKLDYRTLSENMSLTTRFALLDSTEEAIVNDDFGGVNRFMDYLVYPMIGILVYCVGSAFAVFNQGDIRRRNLCSPMPISQSNLLLISCIGLVSLFVYALFMAVSMIFCMPAMLTINGLLYALNAFMLLLVGLSISFLVGSLVKNSSALNAISNVLSLCLAFLSGAFVPQSIMADSVKQIAMLTPTFWYVRASDAISSVRVFDSETLRPIFTDVIMQGIFAMAFIAVGLVVVKLKSRE